MELRFLDVAQQELDETVEYYNANRTISATSSCLKCLVLWNELGSFPKLGIGLLKTAADVRLVAFLME